LKFGLARGFGRIWVGRGGVGVGMGGGEGVKGHWRHNGLVGRRALLLDGLEPEPNRKWRPMMKKPPFESGVETGDPSDGDRGAIRTHCRLDRTRSQDHTLLTSSV
jgi:hypothetical protein